MNVIAIASRKGGSGKSTLTAHLAAAAHRPSHPCLLIDADPQGSLTLWNRLRGDNGLPLKSAGRGIAELIKTAKRDGYGWVLIDTPPNMSSAVAEAIRAATLVLIPARPTVFDLNAVAETIDLARSLRKPYAVVINGAPAKRSEAESPMVAQARAGLARLNVPLWGGQITNRTSLSIALAAGEGAQEFDADSFGAAEIGALWSAVEKSVRAINGAYASASAMHRAAA